MRTVDGFGIAVAILITLVSPLFELWSWQWWTAISIAALMVAYFGGHLLWTYFRWSFSMSRSLAIAATFIVTAAALYFDYWYYSNYSINGGIWHISLGIRPVPPPQEPSGPKPRPGSVPALPPSLPTISRLDRFIFACDSPAPKTAIEEIEQSARIRKNIQIWGDTIGISISFFYIPYGMQVVAEAKTIEAKSRFLSMGIVQGITKVTAEIRRNGDKQLIAVYSDVPKNTAFILGLTPDRSAPQILSGQALIAQFIEVPEDACHLL